MLYSGDKDGLLEGPTWDAYWTQNSYGTSMTVLPFLSDLGFKGMRESQNWWFNNMADGTNQYPHPDAGGAPPAQGWAPDGCSCDNGEPTGCNYKQGDGDVPVHDWTLEETLSAVVMQAELLLVSRNASAAREFLPQALRTSNLIEGRRDPASGMTAFLSGPSSNLLAPSFAGWTLDNGRHAWSWMTGISVTYAAALMRLVEVCRLVDDPALERLFGQRLVLTRRGLDSFLSPDGDYFVRSIDPNGTVHGIHGATRHGYFEASPNHDAVALRVVNDSLARRIVTKITSLGDAIRPNVFILPNTDSNGKPSASGAGGVGYDDMVCGDGSTCGGIWEFGTWVNGGVWTTTEGRWLMAAARTGDILPAVESLRTMRALFADTWRMDNPLVDFGRSPYQPDEDINLTVDNFASAGGLLRGLFEYLYTSTSLTLVPHQPDNVTSLDQNFPVRWGPYALFVATEGTRSSGVESVTLDGVPLAPPHMFNASAVTLDFAAMPPPSAESLAAVNSTFRTARTTVKLWIKFKSTSTRWREDVTGAGATRRAALDNLPRSRRPLQQSFSCVALETSYGLNQSEISEITNFVKATATPPLVDSLAHSLGRLALSYGAGFRSRCAGLNNGTIPHLRSANASQASLVQMLTTAVSIRAGLLNHLRTTLRRSKDPLAAQLRKLWGGAVVVPRTAHPHGKAHRTNGYVRYARRADATP